MSEYMGNRYRIVKLLGKGGMADVYLAYDEILKREVAVKIMKSDMADDPLALERFKREAGAVTKLSHPNIVDVYDVGDEGDKHYIVMEYVRGYTLKQLIQKRGPLPVKEAVWVIRQLAGALMEAHRNNIIHRDVKSQNVLIKDDGTVKLSDFGIAVANDSSQITHKNAVLGSVHYLAPELSRGKQATMQADIYALGIVFYEMLTGDVPFKGETPVQVALKHIKEDIPSVRKINSEIPQSVENIIIKATAKNPNLRYRNVALMLQDLNECLKKSHLNDPKINLKSSDNGSDSNDKSKRKGRKDENPLFSVVFLLFVSLFSIIVLLLVLFFTGVIGSKNKTVTVPNLTNMTVQEAKDLLAEYSLEVDDSRIVWTLSDSTPKDLIISSSPAANEEVERNSKIKLTVSSGIYAVLGEYIGKDYETAQEELIALNFKVRLLPVDSKEEPGKVVDQSLEPGYKYDSAQPPEITLKYSQESSIILSLGLMGMDIEDAKKYFEEFDIRYQLIEKDRDFFDSEEIIDTAVDTVIRMTPKAGTLYNRDSDDVVLVYYYTNHEEPQGEEP
ncbi:MAG: Stk1 family PASTA domain-containing Ser/Thr kinase [Erysipelotrichaceae bacterium]|nr:Stk1 family PASTA domain-containing Ser/Thr kinase [Erysipelotrichaceae bacterium]